ncbi:MAG: hypothetical protein F6J97_08200 [Leptolyngbya sp. SIO4C1]|nr:hypothetical protein [Leptolyngbya sp. SIO4C1]
MPDPIDALSEATGARLDRLEKRVTEYQISTEKRLDEITKQLDRLTTTVSNQAASIDRLERGIERLTMNIENQRRTVAEQAATMNNFLELAKQQTQVVQQALSLAQVKAA